MLAAAVTWLSLSAGPSAQRQVHQIAEDARKTADLGMLEAGKFISFGREVATLYAEEVTAAGVLRNVFVQRRQGEQVVVIVAKSATRKNDPDTGVSVLTFVDGERYEGVPGSRQFRVMRFGEHGIPFEPGATQARALEIGARTIAELLAEPSPEHIAELQWRASAPLTLLVLALLAVPLSRAQPRQGRYSNLLVAVLLYMIYSNLLGASRVWLEKATLSPWLGLWWVHVVFILLAVLLLMQQNRQFRRLFSPAATATAGQAQP